MSIDTYPASSALPAAPATGPARLPRTLAHLGPNWFASVMGTGIVGTAAATLPVQFPGLAVFATAAWLLASAWLVALTTASAARWIRHRALARADFLDPVLAQFFGAPPMAALTVGAGALLLGQPLIGARAAVLADAVLWTAGTLAGLASSVAIPFVMFTRHQTPPDGAFGGWLMPIVPPMVSAATGALLIPHLPAGQLRLTMLLACYAMFGMSLIASVVVITSVWQRLIHHRVGPAAMVPTLWILLGPLGQSVTAVNLLGADAHLALPPAAAAGFAAFGVVYGVPVWGFAMMWAVLAAAMTARAARARMPFSLTWWSFTFPVGTCVTATSGLAAHTGASALRWMAAALYLGLVAAWTVVAARTARGAWQGRLLQPAAPARHGGRALRQMA